MNRASNLPTNEEFNAWMDNPQTKQFFSILSGWREELKEQWALGAYTNQEHFATAIQNAEAIGSCNTCRDILSMTFEGFLQELEK